MTICDCCQKPDKSIRLVRMSTRGLSVFDAPPDETKTMATWELCEACQIRAVNAIRHAVLNPTNQDG